MHTLTLPTCLLALITPTLAAQSPGPPAAAVVSPAQFQTFHWIVGQWRGHGVGPLSGVPTFYEEYTAINDSTIRMRTAADSTFSAYVDSTRFVWRAGSMMAIDARGRIRFVTRMAGDSIQWGSQTGTLYIRLSDNAWRAVFPARASGEARPYYELVRMAAPQ